MKARSFSHTGVTVADFDEFVQFYAEHFGCRLVGVSDSDPARVARSLIDNPAAAKELM